MLSWVKECGREAVGVLRVGEVSGGGDGGDGGEV